MRTLEQIFNLFVHDFTPSDRMGCGSTTAQGCDEVRPAVIWKALGMVPGTEIISDRDNYYQYY